MWFTMCGSARMWRRPLWFVLCGTALALKSLDNEPCNGDPALCHLRVDQVTWAGSHNADAVNLWLRKGVKGGCLTDNHYYMLDTELKDGLHFHDLDTGLAGDAIQIIHGPAKGVMLKPELVKLKEFLVKNPRDIVAISFINADPGNQEHAKVLGQELDDTFGSLIWKPSTAGSNPVGTLPPNTKWPKLSELIADNTRLIIFWGRRIFKPVYDLQIANYHKQEHLRFEKIAAQTYTSAYKYYSPQQLADKLKNFCPEKLHRKTVFQENNVSLVVADAYLTNDPTKRRSLSFCNKDLAGDVNYILYDPTDLPNNPLMLMQQNCWNVNKHVFIVSGDYVEYFPRHLQTVARALNVQNFARYGWVGGKLKLSGTNTATSETDQKKLIKKLAGLKDGSRISIEKSTVGTVSEFARRLAGPTSTAGEVEFSISAPDDAFSETSNIEALEAMRTAAASEAGVVKVISTCRDPGTPFHATRSPPEKVPFFEEGQVLSFDCADDLPAVHGSQTRTCGKDGVFSGIQPVCREASTLVDRKWPWYIHLLIVVIVAVGALCLCGCFFYGICTCIGKLRGKKKEDNEYKQVPEEQTSATDVAATS